MKLVEGLGKFKVIVDVYPDPVRRNNVTELLVVFLFRHFQDFSFFECFAIVFLGEIEEFLRERVVENVKPLRRINLVIVHKHFLLVKIKKFDIIIEPFKIRNFGKSCGFSGLCDFQESNGIIQRREIVYKSFLY